MVALKRMEELTSQEAGAGDGLTLERMDELTAAGSETDDDARTALEATGRLLSIASGSLSKGITDLFGLPFDVFNGLLGLAGVKMSSRSGGEILQDQARAVTDDLLTVGVPPRDQRGLVENVVASAGENIGAGLAATTPLGLAARGLSAAAPAIRPSLGLARDTLEATGRAGGQMARQFRDKPIRTLAAEGLLGATGGVGREAGSQTADAIEAGPTARLALETGGEIAGALTGAGLEGSARGVASFARAAAEPFTEAGARRTAAQRVQSASQFGEETPLRAADRLSDFSDVQEGLLPGRPALPGAEATTGQISRNPGLMALENGVLSGNAAARGEAEFNFAKTNRTGRDALDQIGGPARSEAVQEFFQGRIGRLTGLLDQRTSQALEAAQRKLSALKGTISRSDLNTAARKELDGALSDARTQEKALWKEVYKDDLVATKPIRNTLEALTRRQQKADDPENIPGWVRGLFKKKQQAVRPSPALESLRSVSPARKQAIAEAATPEAVTRLSDLESVDGIMAFRSRILQEVRNENAFGKSPNRKKLANLQALQDASMAALGSRRTDQSRAARQFTKELNDRFTRGPIAQVLGLDTRGGARVDPALTLESLLQGGPKGGVGARSLVDALGGTEAVNATSENFLRRMIFEEAAHSGDRVTEASLSAFRRKYGDVLDSFPAVKSELGSVESAQRVAEGFKRSEVRLTGQVQRSAAALYLKAEPRMAAETVLNSKNPQASMDALVRSAAKDPSGDATAGLKRGFYEAIMRKVEAPSAVDPLSDGPTLVGGKMRKLMRDNSATLSRLFDQGEMRRMNQVNDALTAAERSARQTIRGSDTVQNAAVLHMMAARFLGITGGGIVAKVLGTPALATVNLGSRMARRFVETVPESQIARLLEQAVFDKNVMKDLLMVPTEANFINIVQRLRGHLIPLASDTEQQETGLGVIDIDPGALRTGE